MRRSSAVAFSLVALVALAACGGSRASSPEARSAAGSSRNSAPPAIPAALPFHENDYAGALAEARAKHVPIFVDAWAPWCHSCLSMRAYVFPDARVRAHASEFVWLAMDTEAPENAKWVEAHPMRAWPTVFVIDPESEATVLAWANSPSAPELVLLLSEARGAMSAASQADQDLARGNREIAARKTEDAIASFESAIAHAPAAWSRRAEAVEALVEALTAKKDFARCAEVALREGPTLPAGTSRASLPSLAIGCAEQMPEGDAPRALAAKAIEQGRALVLDDDAALVADDRSGLFGEVVDALESAKRGAEAKELARAWIKFLDGEVAKAKTPDERAVFDAHRLDAYIAVGTPELALPMLRASERDFPRDYNAPARLARAYFTMGKLEDAQLEIDHALELAYGPRRLRLYLLAADILAKKGDRAALEALLRRARAEASTMSLPGTSYPRVKAEIDRRVGELSR